MLVSAWPLAKPACHPQKLMHTIRTYVQEHVRIITHMSMQVSLQWCVNCASFTSACFIVAHRDRHAQAHARMVAGAVLRQPA